MDTAPQFDNNVTLTEISVDPPSICEESRNDENDPKLINVINRRPSFSFIKPTKSSDIRAKSVSKRDQVIDQSNESKHPLKPTVPISPKFRTDSRLRESREKILTSEEQELLKLEEAIKSEKERVAKARKLFEMNKIKSVEASVNPTIFRSMKEVTIPTTPIKHLNARLGKKEVKPDDKVSITAKMTNHNDHDASKPRKPTIPEPFKLMTDLRASNHSADGSSQHDGNMSHRSETTYTAAELENQFFKDARSIHVSDTACKKLTVAEAPQFLTEKRSLSRPKPRPKSIQEIEEEIMEKMKSMQFKAKPVDKQVLYGESHLPMKPSVKPTTECIPFHLSTEKRSEIHSSKSTASLSARSESTSFKALPMPNFNTNKSNDTLESPSSKKPIEKPRVTIPVSPKLHGKQRASSAPHHRQLPHHSILEQQREAAKKFIPTKVVMKLTEPQEFHLRVDDRGSLYTSLQEEVKQRQVIEEEKAREYKAKPANPMIFIKAFQVKASEKALTEVEEFQLYSMTRHNDCEQKKLLQHQLDEELLRKQSQFQALSIPETTYEPEKIHVSTSIELVTPRDIIFASDQRIEERKKWLLQQEEKNKFEQARKEEEEVQRKREEERAIQVLRKKPIEEGGYQFIAQPVITTDLYPTKQVRAIPLTEPKSPVFLTDKRAMMKAKNNM